QRKGTQADSRQGQQQRRNGNTFDGLLFHKNLRIIFIFWFNLRFYFFAPLALPSPKLGEGAEGGKWLAVAPDGSLKTKKRGKMIFFAQKFGGSKIMCTFVGFSAKGMSSLA
ncbi:MAG: hypothetical protein J6R74_03450, partial [Tidjanibacter sp.]|nr:hypothetical protein [Tidjanibacter sp.]